MKSFFDGKIYLTLFVILAIFVFSQLGRNDTPKRVHDVMQLIESDLASSALRSAAMSKTIF